MQFDKRFFIEKLKDFVTDQWEKFTADSAPVLEPTKEAKDVAQ